MVITNYGAAGKEDSLLNGVIGTLPVSPFCRPCYYYNHQCRHSGCGRARQTIPKRLPDSGEGSSDCCQRYFGEYSYREGCISYQEATLNSRYAHKKPGGLALGSWQLGNVTRVRIGQAITDRRFVKKRV
jgi:hypothetical protein